MWRNVQLKARLVRKYYRGKSSSKNIQGQGQHTQEEPGGSGPIVKIIS